MERLRKKLKDFFKNMDILKCFNFRNFIFLFYTFSPKLHM